MTTRYDRTAIVLHWVIAAAILGQVLFGWYLDEIPRGTPARSVYVNLHKSTGLTLGLLILLRVYWRWKHKPPVLPVSMPDSGTCRGAREPPRPLCMHDHHAARGLRRLEFQQVRGQVLQCCPAAALGNRRPADLRVLQGRAQGDVLRFRRAHRAARARRGTSPRPSRRGLRPHVARPEFASGRKRRRPRGARQRRSCDPPFRSRHRSPRRRPTDRWRYRPFVRRG